MRHDLTIERVGLKILVRSPRFPTQRVYEAFEQRDGTWNIMRYEDERQEIAMRRSSRDDAARSLDEIVEAMVGMAGSRV
jgi:hypothetical protein